MQNPLTIAQITDLHLRRHLPGHPNSFRRRGREAFEVLPSALELARERGATLVVLTGDLVDVPESILGSDDYYPLPRERWLEAALADYRLLKKTLDAGGVPYTVLPGNHDHEPSFWQVFARAPLWFDLPQGFRVVRFFDREGDGHVPRRLDRERRQLEGMLADASDFLQIHLQHYVINPTLEGQGYPYNYLEAEHLRTALVASRKVRLALSGHYHPGTDLLCEEGCYFCTAPAFTLAPHPMTIYHLEGGQVRREVVATQTGPLTAGKPVVFVDRDGVLNAQESYSTGPENLTLIAGAADAVARLRSAGWAVVVVTNQSAIGLGYVTESTVCLVNDRLCQLLSEQAGSEAIPDAIVMNAGAGSRAVHPMWQDLSRAKPSPWMLEQAVKELGLRQDGAFLVGDRESDLSAARTFGATPVLVRTGAGRETESSLDLRKWAALDIFDDLSTAVAMILSREG